MAPKQVVFTAAAPKPIACAYSQATVANGTVYCSGQVPLDPITGQLVGGNIGDRTHQCIKKLTHVLEAADTSINNVVKVNVFITDMEDFSTMNAVYKLYWGDVSLLELAWRSKNFPEALM